MSEENNLENIKKFWPKDAPDVTNVPKYVKKYKKQILTYLKQKCDLNRNIKIKEITNFLHENNNYKTKVIINCVYKNGR